MLRSQFHETASDGLGISLIVSRPFGKDVPNDDQYLAGYRHNGLLSTQPGRQSAKAGFPIGRITDGSPSTLDQYRPQFTSPLLGDFVGLIRLAGSMDTAA